MPNFFASKISVKLPPEKKVPWFGPELHGAVGQLREKEGLRVDPGRSLIGRLNLEKNINFGLYNQKSFLTHPNIVFGVTDHFCIKWTLKKMPFSARKMDFCDKNGNLTHCTAQHRTNVKELFFREVILHQFLKQKKIGHCWAKMYRLFWLFLI